jgi:Na+/melibiose symporter-like transporter
VLAASVGFVEILIWIVVVGTVVRNLNSPLLVLAYAALFNPPARDPAVLAIWLALSLVVVYTAHSALTITYLSWGARASEDTFERTRLVAFREAFSLAGVILASLLPMLLTAWLDIELGWLLFSLLFAALTLPALWLLLQRVPMPQPLQTPSTDILQPLRHPPFRRLAVLFLLNGLAMAIAATLALFYIADVLQLESSSGIFLALYFVSGALSLPLWLRFARRFNKTVLWLGGSIMAVAAFVWAVQLGAGDLVPYVIVCCLSGAALGADLVMPSAIAADIIPQRERGRTASYFGIWSLISKAVLALSAGIALPLLAAFGYRPGGEAGLMELAVLYAGVPCVIKLLSAVLLLRWRSSLEI